MDNTFTFEADFPTGTKVLVYDGEDENGNIQTFPRTLRRTTHLMPPNYYLGRRIQGFDLSRIFDNNERARIENERRLAWQNQARRRINDNNNVDPAPVPARMDDNAIPLGRVFVPQGGRKSRRSYDNNNSVPVRMDDDIPLGRVFVPQGGRKSRRGRKSKKSRKRRSRKTNRRRRR